MNFSFSTVLTLWPILSTFASSVSAKQSLRGIARASKVVDYLRYEVANACAQTAFLTCTTDIIIGKTHYIDPHDDTIHPIRTILDNNHDGHVHTENESGDKLNELPQHLLRLDRDLLLESQRRRLTEHQEHQSSSGFDPQVEIKVHLARRLVEYIHVDTSFYSEDSKTLFSSVLSTELSFSSGTNLNTPDFGFGSKSIDECIYSQYRNSDLTGSCHMAVDWYMLASTRNSKATQTVTAIGSRGIDANVLSFIADYIDKLEEAEHDKNSQTWPSFLPIMVFFASLTIAIISSDTPFKFGMLFSTFVICLNTALMKSWIPMLVALPFVTLLCLFNIYAYFYCYDEEEYDEEIINYVKFTDEDNSVCTGVLVQGTPMIM